MIATCTVHPLHGRLATFFQRSASLGAVTEPGAVASHVWLLMRVSIHQCPQRLQGWRLSRQVGGGFAVVAGDAAELVKDGALRRFACALVTWP